MTEMTLHPDRLLPPDPAVRAIARRLYESVKDEPILSPHGHVPPAWIADDVAFTDPVSLLLSPDHYVTRLLHADGVNLTDLGVPPGTPLPEAQARQAWRIFCSRWPLFSGTAMKYWMETVLVDVLGVAVRPSAETADAIYDQIAAVLADPGFRVRALMDRFRIEFIATTDDPCDDLAHHQALADDASFHHRVTPTFRPDKYLEPARPDWPELTRRLGEVAGVDVSTFAGWLGAMRARRAFFKQHGAVSSDHAHLDAATQPLEMGDAKAAYAAALTGAIDAAQAKALQQTMLFEQARMATEDGLTMTLHPGVYRNHSTETFQRYGADVGADIPISCEFTRALHPLLDAFGNDPGLTLVLFTIDETVFSREIAPLAGFYPAVYYGVPWWFIDAPDAIKRFRAAATESAGLSRCSGFIDDTRAFLSIPARHDMARRLDCGYLAGLVADHRLAEDEALVAARQLVVDNPRKVFHLG